MATTNLSNLQQGQQQPARREQLAKAFEEAARIVRTAPPETGLD